MICTHREVMAISYPRTKTLKDGSVRHYAVYLGADGRYHEEGGFKTAKEAAKIAVQRELDPARGAVASPTAGPAIFADYGEDGYWPTPQHSEGSARTALRYFPEKPFLP